MALKIAKVLNRSLEWLLTKARRSPQLQYAACHERGLYHKYEPLFSALERHSLRTQSAFVKWSSPSRKNGRWRKTGDNNIEEKCADFVGSRHSELASESGAFGGDAETSSA